MNWKEFESLVMMLEKEGKAGHLYNALGFLFTNNTTVESCLYHGTSSSKKLFDLVVRAKLLESKFQCNRFCLSHFGNKDDSPGY